MSAIIGWLSSAILVCTVSYQVLRQWRSGTSKGVSAWLFVGQFIASTGFCIYSVLMRDRVFVVTNGLLALSSAIGFAIVRVHRRRERLRASRAPQPQGGALPRALRPIKM
ncbi:MAG TPA: SemiSWEET family transporter [Polyangiales bacterium]